MDVNVDRIASNVTLAVGLVVVPILCCEVLGIIRFRFPEPWPWIHLASEVAYTLLFAARDRLPQVALAVAITLIAAAGVLYPLLQFGFSISAPYGFS